MEKLPLYIPIVFVFTTVFTVFMFYKATNNSKTVLFLMFGWLCLQAAIASTGFYTVTDTLPPRFALLLIPTFVFIIVLFITKWGKRFTDNLSLKTLTLLHILRIPVELVLYWLCVYKMVAPIITFEGNNVDILSGITSPVVYYFGFVKKKLHRNVLIAWNIACLALLANVVITAILSAPFSFQQFGFNQPNVAILYFPYIWLPCLIVPAVLYAHLAALRQLVKVTRK